MIDLFSQLETREKLADGAVLLRGFALANEAEILNAMQDVENDASFRNMTTPGGFRMSVAMTNCGSFGWVTDRKGYRYSAVDPETEKPWPSMPGAFRDLAESAADEAGYADFVPDACLINRYEPGAKMSLHQDKDEKDFKNPIVSVSLGLPATFQFGGLQRSDPVRKFVLHHGDVVVWGGPSRLFYHGILPLKDGKNPQLGRNRYNLTFRKAK
ncbi:DNA oxidative demethylase AlkB [Brucella sp. H1_1004]|uniref:DNA oxidative demethylase AlkB n=1 Tax=Brucella sp. H1_1004 TaxID=3110109 RepID=UPI0039B4DF5A